MKSLLAFPVLITAFVGITFAQDNSFSDGFESGDLSNANDFFSWSTGAYSTISSEFSFSGNNSLKFNFQGNTDLNEDSWSEQRFTFQALQQDIWVRYKMRVPENYLHRKANGAANNKGLLMMWTDPYSGLSQTTSLHFGRPSDSTDDNTGGLNPGGSFIYAAWRANSTVVWNHFFQKDLGADWAPASEYAQGITADDRGEWIDWVIHFKTSTIPIDPGDHTGLGNGKVQVWKNNALIYNVINATNYFRDPSLNGFKKGYLLGWANSGFNEETNFYIDDFAVATSPDGIGFDPGTPIFNGVTCDGCSTK